ncbi:MAG: protein-L-isoaspartate(D-aspartate) O-methyltransferase [Candidatus Eisenbacteria bacterium]|uniref:Protein-L-isoaspartate O-methyltransferase n=1 Tax=Eiseniibacteriota bacterium TaxID=2212470 RepID=A0A7Y2EA44_UNCEI|nr:protein-L-isoaspartate(D-aspartate) O-methyltransferase [Candidatus Eisenbacteria bacterium]
MPQFEDYPVARKRMVETEVEAKGIKDPRVIKALREVPRHFFVSPALAKTSYGASALPIGSGQTISAPHMVGLMSEALMLKGKEKVLEIGTGSGYQAAVLGKLTRSVISIERIPVLASRAQEKLAALGLDGVIVKVSDGTLGLPSLAPYDRILVTAGGPHVPQALWEQLSPDGILVMPIGTRNEQVLMRFFREGDGFREEQICRCLFVPLVGRDGFEDGPGDSR